MEKIASIIHLDEKTENTQIRYKHLEKKAYYPVVVDQGEGKPRVVAFFTDHELSKAIYRGIRNAEDVTRLEAMGRTEKFFKGL